MRWTAVLAAGLLAAPALAKDDASQAPRKRGEWVFVPYIGQSTTQNSSLRIRQPGTNSNLVYQNVHWQDASYQHPLYYGLRATYWPSPESTIGYGIDFIHYKVYADVDETTQVSGTLNGQPYNQNEPINTTLQRFSISHGVNLLTATVYGRRPMLVDSRFPDGRLQPYAGVGAGIVINHPESRFQNGVFKQHYALGGWSWQVLLGAEYRVTDKLGLFAEFKYTDYTPTVSIEGGNGTARLRTKHLAFGTTIRF